MTTDNGNSNGRRWYDSTRIITALMSVVVFFAVAWGTLVFSLASSAKDKNIEQDGRLNNLTYMLEKIDAKLDKVLEKR